MMGVSYKKKTASEVDTRSVSWDVVRWLAQEDLLVYNPERKLKSCNLAPDLRNCQKLFAMIPRFNKRTTELWGNAVAGEPDDALDELDEICPMGWGAVASEES